MILRRSTTYLVLLVTIVNALLLTYCLCVDHQESNKKQSEHKNKLETFKNTSPHHNETRAHQKQGLHSNGKPKPTGGHKKHKNFNETEFLRTLPALLSHDLSVQLPEINFGGYLQSALGGGGGSSSKVLLKIHKAPEAKKAPPKIESVRDRSSRLSKRDDLLAIARPNSSPVMPESERPLKRQKRQTPCNQGDELDDYVDQLFRFGTRIVRAMEPITLPNATIELPDYNIQIFLYEGKGTRAYKFKRSKPAWVYCSNETQSLGLTIEVEELRVAYKYRVISGDRLLFDGDLEARLSPKLQVQFSQAVQPEDSEEPVMQRVDRLRLFRLGRVHVVIRGLGNLTQSLSMIINSYLNDNQEELQPTFRMVEGDAVKMINKMLANVNVPILNVV